MPEGPEIRRAADGLHRAVAGKKAEEVFFAFDRLQVFAPRLLGRRVRAVRALGKACLVHFDRGWVVYTHNQLYGRWFVCRAGTLPRTRRSLRFAVHTHDRSVLLYSASEIEVLRREEIATHPYLGRLGPDPLDRKVTPEKVAERLAAERFRRRSLAALLLDQSFLAGIGNYLRSEIAFFAGIDPRRRPADLDDRRLAALARAGVTIPRRSYRTGGITNRPTLAAGLKRQGLLRRDYRHAVFGRAGGDCWVCETPIERLHLAGRRAYVCPTCQPTD